ncbi:MAG: hypothetical protein JXA60_03875 [Candidatus Coatesbacteria bacterium]|nr:hypothetical protein [Candidatus Coatesbacteria bacterium]
MKFLIVVLIWIDIISAWHCPMCNNINEDTSTRCPNCNFKKVDSIQFSCCKKDATSNNNPDLRYCMDCGYDTKTGLIRKVEFGTNATKITISNDASILAYRDTTDRSIRLMRFKDLTEINKINTADSNDELFYPFKISPDNNYLSTRSRLFQAKSGKEILSYNSVNYGYNDNGTAFSNDSRLFAYTNKDSSIIILEIETGKQLKKLRGFAPLAFSNDGKFLVCIDEIDYSVILWNIKSGKRIVPSKEINDGIPFDIGSYAFTEDNKELIIGMFYNTEGIISNQLYVWDLKNSKNNKKLDTNSEGYFGSTMSAICLSKDNKYLATSGSFGKINIWDTDNWKIVKTLMGSSSNISKLVYTDNNKLIALTGEDITVWNPDFNEKQDFRLLKKISGSDIGGFNHINISSSGKYVTSESHSFLEGSEYWDLTLWDTETGKIVKKYQNGCNGDIRFHDDKCYFAATVIDTLEKTYVEYGDLKSDKINRIHILDEPSANFFNFIRIMKNSKILMNTIGLDEASGSFKIIDTETLKILKEVSQNLVIAISADENYILATEITEGQMSDNIQNNYILDAINDKKIYIKDLKIANYSYWIDNNTSGSYSAIFSSDNHMLAYTAEEDVIKIMKTDDLNNLSAVKGRSPVAFCRNSSCIAVSSENGFKIYRIDTGSILHEFKSCNGMATCFKAMNNRIIAGFKKGDIAVFEINPEIRLSYTMHGHSTYIDAFCLTEDEERLFSASRDGVILIWNLK